MQSNIPYRYELWCWIYVIKDSWCEAFEGLAFRLYWELASQNSQVIVKISLLL